MRNSDKMIRKKVPLRKCTGCREMKPKKELIRIVKCEDGTFKLDTTGKMQGRGAYICPNTQCLELAHQSKGLERSFKEKVPQSVYEELKEELEKG